MREPTGNIVICGPPEAAKGIPGLKAINGFCTGCGEPVVYSESTAAHVRTGQLLPMCGECGLLCALEQGDPTFLATKETLKTMEQQGIRPDFERYLGDLNRIFGSSK